MAIPLITFELDPSNLPKLTVEEATQLDAAPIDHSDIPKVPAGFWNRHRPTKTEG